MDTFDVTCLLVAVLGLFMTFCDFCDVTISIIKKKNYKSILGSFMDWFRIHELWYMPPIVLFLFIRGIFLL